ncbi:MAG: DUF6883 domain-containing protein [Thermodesulfobacteriota bacterium]
MSIPGFEIASIPPAKIAEYILSLRHPVGKAKAKFFRSHGYSDENTQIFAEDLRRIAAVGRVVEQESTPYGMKYVIEGSIVTPRSTTIVVRTVWFADREGGPPRFVTAYYPGGERR